MVNMNNKDREVEVKFYIQDMVALERRLLDLGAEQERERTSEVNLRFDTQSGKLQRRMQLLRLRQDHSAHLTYKGRSQVSDGVLSRQEIEFELSDFEAAKRLLEVLGFRVVVIYEKFRTTYRLDGLEITLDELPYGNFVEIEGEDEQQIRSIAEKIELDFDTAVESNYLMLFEELKKRLGLKFRDLTFENFAEMAVTAEQLGVQEADLG
jgi:adenylate cyclase class 2